MKLNDFNYKIKDIKSFFTDCVCVFHEEAKTINQATKDVIFIPELIMYGEADIIKILNNDSLQQKSKTAEEYYYNVLYLSLKLGILYASYWHENYKIESEKLLCNFDMFDSNDFKNIITNDLNLNNDEFIDFSRILFDLWLKELEPYWNLSDPRKYIFKSFVAVYQLGISMELCKLGY